MAVPIANMECKNRVLDIAKEPSTSEPGTVSVQRRFAKIGEKLKDRPEGRNDPRVGTPSKGIRENGAS